MKIKAEDIIGGDQLAGARLIRLLEEGDLAGIEVLKHLYPHTGRAFIMGLTGPPGSGKSTLANATARELLDLGICSIVLDGDNIRHGLNKNLGFSHEDRIENIRRIGEVAKLFTSAAVINLTAFISPYESDRQAARALQPESFVEVYCHAPLTVCEERDPKGLYRKARAGEIVGFEGKPPTQAEPVIVVSEIHLWEGRREYREYSISYDRRSHHRWWW